MEKVRGERMWPGWLPVSAVRGEASSAARGEADAAKSEWRRGKGR